MRVTRCGVHGQDLAGGCATSPVMGKEAITEAVIDYGSLDPLDHPGPQNLKRNTPKCTYKNTVRVQNDPILMPPILGWEHQS